MISVVEKIFDIANQFPDRIAVISDNKRYSYLSLVKSILDTKKYLENELNVKNNDRILLAADKNIEFIFSYFALHLINAIVIPVAQDTNSERLSFIINKTKAKYAIGIKSDSIESVKFYNPIIDKLFLLNIKFPSIESSADILFTTGTTGRPKGVLLSHKNLSASARNINQFIKNNEKDIELIALPISHSFGLGRIRCVLSKGSTIVLLGSFVNLKLFFRSIKENSVSGLAMVPSAWEYIKKMSGSQISNYKKQLNYIEFGSSFLRIEEKESLMTLLPNTRLCMHYGLTEASRSCFIEFHSEDKKLSTIGKASPNVEIKIFDEFGKDCSPGIEGEICIKGEHVFSNYWEEESHDSFRGDFFRTGDLGFIDSDGYITLSGRLSETINVGGKKLSPIEVEQKINLIKGVRESVCVGVKDKDGILGEVVKAFIVKDHDSISFEEISSILSSQLEKYKIPKEYEWIEIIPKTSSGKIQRLKLK